MMKRYHKIKWLSKWQASTILCDNLKSVTTYYHDSPIEKDDGFTPLMYKKLKSFKLKYYRYFLAYIFHMLSSFSKRKLN